jgi:hypothetical protein
MQSLETAVLDEAEIVAGASGISAFLLISRVVTGELDCEARQLDAKRWRPWRQYHPTRQEKRRHFPFALLRTKLKHDPGPHAANRGCAIKIAGLVER